MKTLAELQQREAEFRQYTNDWIKHQDRHYGEVERTEIAKNKPLRHPKGETHDRHTRRYLWGDALYCQDRHSEPFQMFFFKDDEDGGEEAIMEMSEDQDTDTENGKVWEWFTNIFNEEFVKVCPDLKEVLEG
jgi:hypothetical protein